MKRQYCLTITILFITIFQLSCSGESEEKTNNPIILTVWDYKYGEVNAAGPVFKEMDRLFMEQYPDIIIKHIGKSSDRYFESLKIALAGGTSPDIAMFSASSINIHGNNLIDLDDYINPWRDQISESIWKTCTVNRIIGDPVKVSPITIQGRGFYYNKKLFIKAGLNPENPPVEWSDFLAACEKLKDADIIPIIWGNNNAEDSGYWLFKTFLGTFYNDEDHRDFISSWDFNSKEVKTAISMVKELQDSEYLDPLGNLTPLWMDAIEKFKEGQGAIFHGLLSDIAHWKDFSDTLGKDNIGYFPNINHPNAKYRDAQIFAGAGISFGIYESCENKDAAALYLKHYSTGEALLLYLKKAGALLPYKDLDYSYTGYPIVYEIMNSINNFSVTGGFGPKLNKKYNNDIISNLELLLNTKEITVDEFLTAMQNSIEVIE
ncbi:MAG: extracellular solute-binding protein [Spirochaetaceae bacterium]